MKHNRKRVTLDRKNGPRKALLRGLVTSVVLYENINTTLAKAKAVQPIVERMITISRAKTLTSRRRLMKVLTVESAVNKMLEEIGPRYATRPGGYTRIIKLGTRQGDGAQIAQLQLIKE